MDKDIKKGFFVEPDDFENFKKNGDLLVSSFEYVINEKFGMKYLEFYHFIYPYISYSERMLAKYEILELTSSLYKEDIEIKNLLLEESEIIFNKIIQTENLQAFLNSLITDNKEEESSLNAFIDEYSYGDDEQDDIKCELSALEDDYYNKMESYFENPTIQVENTLNNILNKEERAKYLFNEDNDGNSFFRSKKNIFDDIIATSDNCEARAFAGEVMEDTCSEHSKYYNGDNALNIIKNRLELAKSDGFKNHFEKRKDIRALKEIEDVTLLLDSVLAAFKPKAKSELEVLRIFIKDKYNVDNLKIEDLNYYIENYKNEKFQEIGFDINEYFSVENVIYGGLNLVEKVFGIKFIENKNFFNNKDIKYFDIYVQDDLVFQAVFDLYERTEKQMSGFVSDIKPNLNHEAGIMYMSCSFSEKVTLDDIEVYLHELGHCVDDVFSSNNFHNLSNSNGSYQDLVEIPSMMFERFLFNKDFFEIVKKKKEILDYSLIDKAFDIHNFFKSYHVCKQIAYAYYDLKIHNLETIMPIEDLDEMFEDIVNKCIPAGMLPCKNTLFQFDHVFSSGYDTYYYCYVLADFYGSFYYSKIANDYAYAKVFEKEFLTSSYDNVMKFIKCDKDEVYEGMINFHKI